ncbi:unnamed protein product, partial [Brenthis ino]
MSSRSIPATAANLIETSQLRRRYYSAQVYAQTQRALSIPVTLILRWDDTRHDRSIKRTLAPNIYSQQSNHYTTEAVFTTFATLQ